MSKIKTGALALLIPLALAMPAFAGPGQGGRMEFSQMDLNADGVITREEMQAGPSGMLAAADADGDGSVTRDEMIAAATARSTAMIDRMLEQADSDGDNALSAAEIEAMQNTRRTARMERMFDRIDVDGDGQISAEEMEAARDQRGWGDGHGDRRSHGFWRG